MFTLLKPRNVLGLVLIWTLGSALVAHAQAVVKSHEVTVQFVSFDAKTNMASYKDAQGQQQSAYVAGTLAVRAFRDLKPGDKVTMTLTDNVGGAKQGVTQVRLAAQPK